MRVVVPFVYEVSGIEAGRRKRTRVEARSAVTVDLRQIDVKHAKAVVRYPEVDATGRRRSDGTPWLRTVTLYGLDGRLWETLCDHHRRCRTADGRVDTMWPPPEICAVEMLSTVADGLPSVLNPSMYRALGADLVVGDPVVREDGATVIGGRVFVASVETTLEAERGRVVRAAENVVLVGGSGSDATHDAARQAETGQAGPGTVLMAVAAPFYRVWGGWEPWIEIVRGHVRQDPERDFPLSDPEGALRFLLELANSADGRIGCCQAAVFVAGRHGRQTAPGLMRKGAM